MEGSIASFRRGKHTVRTNQMIVKVKGIDKKDKAAELVGKIATWTSPGKKEIKGKITAVHGNSGAVRVKFETGMPGQSLAQKIKIE